MFKRRAEQLQYGTLIRGKILHYLYVAKISYWPDVRGDVYDSVKLRSIARVVSLALLAIGLAARLDIIWHNSGTAKMLTSQRAAHLTTVVAWGFASSTELTAIVLPVRRDCSCIPEQSTKKKGQCSGKHWPATGIRLRFNRIQRPPSSTRVNRF